LTTLVYHDSDWHAIAPEWRVLTEESPYSNFCLTAEWVEAWLTVFGTILNPDILLFKSGNTLVGAGLSVPTKYNYKFIPVSRTYLNTAGEPEGGPYIEFNDLLCLAGFEREVAEAFRTHVDSKRWDEIAIHGFSEGKPLEALRSTFGEFEQTSDVKVNYYVDLKQIRAAGSSYESILGSSTRSGLRQTYKACGDIVTEEASDVEMALAFLEEMADLHQKHWIALGEAGSFASPLFAEFHRNLIRRSFSQGAIQFLRFSAGGSVIGLMYNFVHRGRVYFYQSGLAYSENKRVRPGIVSIGKAVQYSLERPQLIEFHLMPSGDHYKQRMTNASNKVEWLLIRKRNLRKHTVDALRAVNRKLRSSQPAAVEAQDDQGSSG
jgi:CelD/BcsL family acetyltransferase involved in cellulose biosynthesis